MYLLIWSKERDTHNVSHWPRWGQIPMSSPHRELVRGTIIKWDYHWISPCMKTPVFQHHMPGVLCWEGFSNSTRAQQERMRPSVREVCRGSGRGEYQHMGSNLPYPFWKGISLFDFLAKDLNQLLESWAYWCSSRGDSCGPGASVMSHTYAIMLDCSLLYVQVVLWHTFPAELIGMNPWLRNEC